MGPVDHRSKDRPLIGLALGSGAARGWAHMGVLRALNELDIKIDVYAGCSAGALVAAAQLLGITEQVSHWAKNIGPIDAITRFGFGIARGGLINPDKAFDMFRDADQAIENLSHPFGAIATDLSTGKEVWLTQGSAIDACRASTAVPLVVQAASYKSGGEEHWLIDGAASNPVPVTLARALGADRVIAVDLNATTIALSRFDRPVTREVVAVEPPKPTQEGSLTAPLEVFLKSQSQDLSRRFALAKAKAHARPQFFETALTTMDILQSQLAEARARADTADLRLTPDLSGASAVAFDQWAYFEHIGYCCAMNARDALQALSG